MNEKDAKILTQTTIYPDGANTPTHRTEYLCPCGQGKIVYERVAGFNDRYAFIECEKCKNEYVVKTGAGNNWELVKK